MKRWWSVSLAAAAAVSLGAACGVAHLRDTSRAVVQVDSGPIAERIVVRGSIVPRDGVARLRPRVEGSLLRVLVRVGEVVHTGDLLAVIDSPEARLVAQRREEEARAADEDGARVARGERAELRDARKAELEITRAELAHARRQAERTAALAGSGAAPSSAKDDADRDERLAGERVRAAEAHLAMARHGDPAEVRAALARARAAKTAVEEQHVALSWTEIVSPISGTVVRRSADPGDTVRATDTEPLFEIADTTHTELRLEVEETDAARVSIGAEVTLDNPAGGVVHGHISRMNPRVEVRTRHADGPQLRADGMVKIAMVSWDEDTSPQRPLGERVDALVHLPMHVAQARLPRAAVHIRDGEAAVSRKRGLFFRDAPVGIGVADETYVEVKGIELGAVVALE